MLGSGFICDFYTSCLHKPRSADRIKIVYSRTEEKARKFAQKWSVPHSTTSMKEAINHPEVDTVIISLPNDQRVEPVRLCAEAGKTVLCTKPLGRTAAEAKEMLELVEKAGIFH